MVRMGIIKYCLSFILISCFVGQVSAQTGIGTETPQSALHIAGDKTLTGEFKVGGDESTEGNPGTEGQVLKSNGIDSPPLWSDLDKVTGASSIQFYEESPSAYTFTDTSATFIDIPGLVYSFTSPATGELILQTVIFSQIDNPSSDATNNVEYRIFVNENTQLRGVGSPSGFASNGFNPECEALYTRFAVTEGQVYDIRIRARQAYTMGGANASVGKIVSKSVSSTSSMMGTLISTE